MSQVKDNLELLNQMMFDLKQADTLYQPTNYWAKYESKMLSELLNFGLKDFRRKPPSSIFSSFGAIDTSLSPIMRIDEEGKTSKEEKKAFIDFVSKYVQVDLFYTSVNDATKYFYEYVKEKFEKQNLDLDLCPTSSYGNPERGLIINDSLWTMDHLQNCLLFLDSLKYIEIGEGIFFDLGSGLGRIPEIVGKLYPDKTIIVCDIPPQLYVANQYLKSVFGNRVVEYQENIEWIEGKIIILPTWLMPKWLEDIEIEVFWNSASFCEMEPNIVGNYLELAKEGKTKYVCINALPNGAYLKKEQIDSGVIFPVTEDYYKYFMEEDYQLKAEYKSDYFLKNTDYKSYIFERKIKDR